MKMAFFWHPTTGQAIPPTNHCCMTRNYFIHVFRALSRHLNYTIINIAGLTAGIAVCLLIFVIIRFETSFDTFHTKAGRIYRILTEFHHADAAGVFYGADAPQSFPSVIKSGIPDLKTSSGIYKFSNDQVSILKGKGQTEKKFKEKSGVFAVQPDFFDMFDFAWLAGDPHSSLNDPHSAVLTKETAIKYFGDWKNALGRKILLDNMFLFKVTGILATIPANTDFQFKIVLPYGRMLGFYPGAGWGDGGGNHDCYILLPPGETQASIDRQLRALGERLRPADDKNELVTQPLSEVHYYDSQNHLQNFLGRTISREVIRVLWIIAAFILLIACVNFINLSTAQAVNRAREVGVRKVLGSSKGQLRRLFLLEAFLQVFVSVVLAATLTSLVIGPVGRLLDLPLSFEIFKGGDIPLFLLGLTLAVTILAGFYPSILLSGYNPVNALKSKIAANKTSSISLRRGLVVFQFVIAQAMIIATIIIVRQMNYFNQGSMGFDKDAIVTVPIPPDSAGNSQIAYLRNSLTAMPGIKSISFNSNPPATDENNWTDFEFDNDPAKGKELYSIIKFTDAEYLPTFSMPLAAGRNFSSDTAHEFLVSENLVHKLGITNPEEALNKNMVLWGGFLKGKVVGVLKDFHSTGFKDKYSLILMVPYKKAYNTAGIKLTSGNPAPTLAAIEKLWNKTFPNYVFEYKFLDDSIEAFYRQEEQQAQLYKIFAAIAIFLGCLGLYGLASFMAIQRTKEVGIRKVLGASIQSIVYLFTKEFAILIGIAFLIASPIAWYFMHRWLQDYAFRLPITWWIFLIGGAASFTVALLTISFNAMKAAMANPVKSLRTE
jgi:ABC-type antimicrobial peptide transport system permease subunit